MFRQLQSRCVRSVAAGVRSHPAPIRAFAPIAIPIHNAAAVRNNAQHARNTVRCFSSSSSASVGSTSSSSSSSPTSSSSSSSSDEIKMQAYYIGSDALANLTISSAQAAAAYKFTQPNSVLIPLGTNVTASGPRACLTELFSLPPVPVAPIVRIPSASTTPTSSASVLPSSSSLVFDSRQPCLIAFSYGAVVFMNVSESQQQEILPRDSKMSRLKDDYKILLHGRENDSFNGDVQFLTDSVKVTGLDLNAVRIFSQILSQTVAMQYYESEADRLLIKLRAMLRPSELRKSMPTLGDDRGDLIVRYAAACSIAMVDVLTELKLLDRSEIVWGQGQYDPLWSGLKREFDLSDRWEALQTKLDLLRDGRDVLLSIDHHRSGHFMEVVIIALIAIEVILSIVFHSPLIPFLKESLGFVDEAELIEAAKNAKAIKH